jgi:hypothetical protein
VAAQATWLPTGQQTCTFPQHWAAEPVGQQMAAAGQQVPMVPGPQQVEFKVLQQF